MKMTLILILTIFLSARASASGSLSEGDGNWLLQTCGEADKPVDQSSKLSDLQTCLTYISGVTDGFTFGLLASTKEKINEGGICPPEGVILGQKARIVKQYLDQHPQELHKPAVLLIIRALHSAFPCKF
jgi:hypothetical protein